MSFRVVHAGGGYQYLLRSVATNDAYAGRQQLHDYYAAKGTPQGRWIGKGLAGLATQTTQRGTAVTEEQMSALYGEGLHPDTDRLTDQGQSLDDCKLGRAFPVYTKNDELLAELAAAERSFKAANDRRPDENERTNLAIEVGTKHFFAAHDRGPENNREVVDWVNARRNDVRQAVSGYDMTFSPMKSVSALWAIADKETANAIASIHHRAVASALEFVQKEALFTRDGFKGIQQVKTQGLIAAEFTHFDTRTGDPDLHSHVLVSNKVQNENGQWRSIDGRPLHQAIAASSQYYNAQLKRLLEREMGLAFIPRFPDVSKQPIWELDGVPQHLLQQWSGRREMARPLYKKAVANYIAAHGHAPGVRANHALWQQAILDTRDAKRPAESLDDLRAQWMDSARSLLGRSKTDSLVRNVLKRGRNSQGQQPFFDPQRNLAQAARDAVDLAMSRRSSIRDNHVATAVIQTLQNYRFTSEKHYLDTQAMVTKRVYDKHLIVLTPADEIDVPAELRSESGAVIDRKANDVAYTTQKHLDAEQNVVDSTQEPQPLFVESTAIDRALEQYTRQHGFSLNAGQEQMVRYLLNAGVMTAVAVGPAGTGKTTSMELVTQLWEQRGRKVIGLAPSAAAAEVLQRDIGTECVTIDSLTYHWNTALSEGLSPREICATDRFSHINAGDMLLVDEAGMVSTTHMSTLVDIARHTGATIRMIGDPYQLDSLEAGGLFRTLTNTPGTPVLQEVMRMRYRDDDGHLVTDNAQADASLKLRAGNASGLDVHDQRGWITSGAREEMLVSAVDAYRRDTDAGYRSLVVASTNEDVAALNEMIRSYRIDNREVDTRHERQLADGLRAGRGDLILARRNAFVADPKTGEATRVTNGQVLNLRTIRRDGSIVASDVRTGEKIMLDSEYVSRHVNLGYASTVYRSQGATVDTAHVVADTRMDRNSLYVGLTRGKRENRIYTVLERLPDELAEDAHLHSAGNDQGADTALDILYDIVAHDDSQRSALDTITHHAAELADPKRKLDLYIHAAHTATRDWAEATADRLIDGLPAFHSGHLPEGSDGRQAIENALVDASYRGVRAEDFWTVATEDIDWADSPGRLIGSRIRRMTDRVASAHTHPSYDVPVPPSFVAGADPELALWMEHTFAEMTGTQTPAPMPTPQPVARTVDTPMSAAPSAADVMVGPRKSLYTGQQAVTAISKVRTIDTKLERLTAAIESAEAALASGEDVPENLATRVDTARQTQATLTQQRADLTDRLPEPELWEAMERATAYDRDSDPARDTSGADHDQGMEM